MKRIFLSKGKLSLVDDEDFEWLSQWEWHAKKHGYTFCAGRKIQKNYIEKTLYMHRQILIRHLDLKRNEIVDHIDGNALNNQKDNLRKCNTSQNNANRRMAKNNKTGYKGVHLHTINKTYIAKIKKNKVIYYLGTFYNKIDAAKAYNEAALKYHGEFARLNVV